MQIHFSNLSETAISNLNDGQGMIFAKMFIDSSIRIMVSTLPPGSSIGLHHHTDNSEVNYVISGSGKAACNGLEESLGPGDCHYCPKGSTHSITNTGAESLVLFTVVPKQ